MSSTTINAPRNEEMLRQLLVRFARRKLANEFGPDVSDEWNNYTDYVEAEDDG